MNVRKVENIGITQIATSDYPDRSSIPPEKKPYIVFTLPPHQKSVDYLRDIKSAKLGVIVCTKSKLTLTVTSDQKVIQAIDIFLKESSIHSHDENKELIAHLNTYRKKCQERHAQKPKKLPPLKSKPYSKFEKIADAPYKTTNVTYLVKKKEHPEEEYIYKGNPSGRSISEIEVFNSLCYQLLLDDCHPNVIAVHGENGERVGLVSRKIPDLESFYDFYKSNKPSEQDLVEAEVAAVWVSAYVEEENDLHSGNYGIRRNSIGKVRFVKYDNDQTTRPLTSKYVELDPKKERTRNRPAPINAFPVTERDILNFPKLEDAKPDQWPSSESIDTPINIDYFIAQEKFVEDKWYMFLRRILIPDEMYEVIGFATIRSEKTRRKFIDHKCNKTKELKKVLLNIPEFQTYVITHPDVIEKIKAGFATYNQNYTKEKYQFLRVNLDQIQENFNRINQEIYAKKGVPVPEKFHKKPSTETNITLVEVKAVQKPSFFARLKKRMKQHPIYTGLMIGLGATVFAAIIVTVAVFTGGIAAGPIAAAAIATGAVITGATGTTTAVTGAIAIGTGLAIAGAALGAAGGAIYKELSSETAEVGITNNKKISIPVENNVENNRVILPSKSNQSWKKAEIKPGSVVTHSMFNQSHQIDNDDVINFLSKNIDFFIAPFKDQQSFYKWANKNKDAITPLSDGLRSALPNDQEQTDFYYALVGFYENGKSCLKKGDSNKIRLMLTRNLALTNLLAQHREDPVIAKWYEDHPKKFNFLRF